MLLKEGDPGARLDPKDHEMALAQARDKSILIKTMDLAGRNRQIPPFYPIKPVLLLIFSI